MKMYEISQEIRSIMNEKPEPDERELTRRFLRLVSQNRRIKHYQVTQQDEAIIGADWLWLIYTNAGVYGFLIQAKKLQKKEASVTRRILNYKSNSGARQIDLLLKQSKESGMPALYVLFSNQIQHIACGYSKPKTTEGVFFDSASNLYDHFFGNDPRGPKNTPISCLFSCFSKKCNYFENCKLCKVCKYCDNEDYCLSTKSSDGACSTPFELLLKGLFGISYEPSPIDEKMLFLTYAESVLKKHPQYVIQCLSHQFSNISDLPSQIIVSDYANRHGRDYLKTIMGADFVVDHTHIYSAKEIIQILKEKKQKYSFVRRIGLFGSYAKNEANGDSDIDIALVYSRRSFSKFEDLFELISLIKDIMGTFQKNIDFIDYNSACENENSIGFIEDINAYIKWI